MATQNVLRTTKATYEAAKVNLQRVREQTEMLQERKVKLAGHHIKYEMYKLKTRLHTDAEPPPDTFEWPWYELLTPIVALEGTIQRYENGAFGERSGHTVLYVIEPLRRAVEAGKNISSCIKASNEHREFYDEAAEAYVYGATKAQGAENVLKQALYDLHRYESSPAYRQAI
jgi:hypothetical protein